MAKKPEFWEYPLGADADINSLATDPDNTKGDVSLRGLFPVLTSTRLKDGGIPPQRKDINALFKIIGENIYFLQHGGQFEWSDSITYDPDAVVMRSSTLYRAKQQTENEDPLTNPGIWEKLIQVTSADLEAIRRELPTDATTETKGVTRLSDEINTDVDTAITPNAVNGLKDDLLNLKSDYEGFKATVNGLSGGAIEQTERIQALEDGLRENNTNDDHQDERLNTLENNLQNTNSRIDGITSFDPTAINDSITAVQSDVAVHTTDIASIKSDMDDIKVRATDHENGINDLNNAVADLDSASKGNNAKNQEQDSRLNNIESDFNDILGVFEFATTDEYIAGNVVLFENELYICQTDITKPGKPAEVGEDDAGYAEYLQQKEAWENAETGISINDRNYWIPASKGTKYDDGISYDKGDLVVQNHKIFECLQSTKGNTPQDGSIWKELTQQPSLGIFAWDETTTFKAGQVVLVDKVLYKCVKSNIGNNPSLDSVNNNANWIALNSGSGSSGSSADIDSLSAIIATLPTAGIFTYSNGKTYSKNQVVRYGNNLWLASDETSDVPTDNSTWVRLAKCQAEDVRNVMADVITYNANVRYKVNDVVQYSDYLWRATSANTGVTPSDGSVWKRLCVSSNDDAVIKALKSRIDEVDALDNEQQTRLTTLETNYASIKNKVDGLDLDEVNTSLQNAVDTVDGLKTRVNALETDSGSKKTQIEALQADVADLKLHDTAVQTAIDGIQTDVDGLKDAGIDQMKTDISNLKAEDVSIKSRLQTLEDATTGGVDLSAVTTDIANLQTDVGNLKKIDHSQYALKSEIPEAQDLSNYALKSEIPESPDLSGYALKSEIPEVPDTGSLATKASVDTLTTQVQQNTTDIANLKKNSGSSSGSGSGGTSLGRFVVFADDEAFQEENYYLTVTYSGEEGAVTGCSVNKKHLDPVTVNIDDTKYLSSLCIHVEGDITKLMLTSDKKIIQHFVLVHSDGIVQPEFDELDPTVDEVVPMPHPRMPPSIQFMHVGGFTLNHQNEQAAAVGKVYYWMTGDDLMFKCDTLPDNSSKFGDYTGVDFVIKMNF